MKGKRGGVISVPPSSSREKRRPPSLLVCCRLPSSPLPSPPPTTNKLFPLRLLRCERGMRNHPGQKEGGRILNFSPRPGEKTNALPPATAPRQREKAEIGLKQSCFPRLLLSGGSGARNIYSSVVFLPAAPPAAPITRFLTCFLSGISSTSPTPLFSLLLPSQYPAA